TVFYSVLASFGSKMVAAPKRINLVEHLKEIKRTALFPVPPHQSL
ncbi:hypothetical protein HKBW3S44_01505, partial [Candidatus Hakubella thermalkaliphila]